MKLSFFKIKKLKKEDIPQVKEWIDSFFPYTNFSNETISEKIKDENFILLKHHQKNIITGFAELQFLKKKARLNALFVEEAWRGQGIGSKLMSKIIHHCKRKRLHKLFLLVKKSNAEAKTFYKKMGFEFEKMHDKELDGSKVEVWSMKIH